MEIKDIRSFCNLSQREFAECFGIPLGTLRNWEQGIAKPADYVTSMIIATLRRDKMINVETMKFYKLMDKLASQSKEGILPFSKATEENQYSHIFYNENDADEKGRFPVVQCACIIDDPDCLHHDIISYQDDDEEEYTIRAVIDNSDKDNVWIFLQVCFAISEETITIEDGKWYF